MDQTYVHRKRKNLIADNDRIFSIVIRKRHADAEGYVKCGTCPTISHWTAMTCGHLRKRRHMNTRWNLMNAGPQCSVCNGKDKDMTPFINNCFGEQAANEMIKLSNVDIIRTVPELQEINDELKRLL